MRHKRATRFLFHVPLDSLDFCRADCPKTKLQAEATTKYSDIGDVELHDNLVEQFQNGVFGRSTWHYAAENGEQDKRQSCPPFSSASFYGKIGSTTAAVIVSYCGALPRTQTSSKEQNEGNGIPRSLLIRRG